MYAMNRMKERMTSIVSAATNQRWSLTVPTLGTTNEVGATSRYDLSVLTLWEIWSKAK